ncbi:homoserine kinase [Fructilactobacillus fructivorans]|uniref:Homoserine kinase n=1 Tax=Fructilactobacillus fructivorans TaxID=1614 RepID=A0AAE6P2C4_9LACO|nr:homoserine kinase [Fructilactobacillus fructivorans]KRK57685.1 homoserine kinase [Fructilactobacillus fructivorans]KRN40563.1 homoserine kinase [Fructilactobacillus fructivorans]KRN42342.1 homoserine kinase [Fructilactobacillus fructivorans]QFX93033.1 homoserine kinase [Fructilactobacillus fructivorans]RDV65364.1 homoserine kinase [Fructilactobacillus fructivorans]
MEKIIVRVPATSGNVGNGYSSIGLALHMYYTVIVEEETEKWRVNHAFGDSVPHDDKNLVVQTILKVNPKIMPHQLTVMSDVPLEKGLGSSTTAIAAGIKIANKLENMNLSVNDQINIGSRMEGHPDNIASAILGDITISHYEDGKTDVVKAHMPDEMQALVFIRNEKITQKKGMERFPKEIKFAQEVQTSSASNVFVAALMQKDWDKAAHMVEADSLIRTGQGNDFKDFKVIQQTAHELGIYGTYISGVGSSIITLGDYDHLTTLQSKIENNDQLDGKCRLIDLDRDGATIRGED